MTMISSGPSSWPSTMKLRPVSYQFCSLLPQSGRDESLSHHDLSRFERRAQAGQLADLLNELAASPDAERARLRGALPQAY